MSAENVELVRRSLEAFARGDLDTFFAAHDPDIEWTTGADEPDPQTYRGAEGMRRFTADTSEAWVNRLAGAVRFTDFIDRGDGAVVEVYETYAIRVKDGRIVRVDEYRTTEEALEACEHRGSAGGG